MECPKCGYIRQATDTAPAYECPKCGVVYAKYDPGVAKAAVREARSATGGQWKRIATFAGLFVWVIAGLFAYAHKKEEEAREAKLAAVRAEEARRQRAEEAKARAPDTAAKLAAYKANAANFRTAAMVWCDSAIKGKLDDPYSADFDSTYGDEHLAGLHGSQWSVKRHLRAKNRFGAFERQLWGCTVDVTGGEARVLVVMRIQ